MADLDLELCVCSLVTLPSNGAVPPPWHSVNVGLCYQTEVTADWRSPVVHPCRTSSADGGEGSPVCSAVLLAAGLADLGSTHDVLVSPVNDCTEPVLPCLLGVRPGRHKGNQAVQRQFSSECKHPLHQPFQMWFQNKPTKDTSVCYCCCLPVLNICANLQFSRQAVFLVVTCEYHVSY